MYDLDEKIITLRKYLKKLLQIINNDAVFTLINTKLINKNKVDDILCCIEGSFPEFYKDFVKTGTKQLKSYNHYKNLLFAIRNHFWLNTSLYSVHYKEAEQCIAAVLSSLESDIRYVYNNESGLS